MDLIICIIIGAAIGWAVRSWVHSRRTGTPLVQAMRGDPGEERQQVQRGDPGEER
jgi:hypothetical protein